jgi:hypothetical protein
VGARMGGERERARRSGGESAAPSAARLHGVADEVVRKDDRLAWVFAPHPRLSLGERWWPLVRWWGLVGGLGGVLAVEVLRELLGSPRWAVGWWLLRVAVAALAAFLAALVASEWRDGDRPPAEAHPEHVANLEAEEDEQLQNHLASLTVVKPGAFRRLTLRLVLWVVNLRARTLVHGTLSGITSIHFASWTLIDGGRRLLFFSNYDGSWASYLDEFIDRAAPGLSAIWSNTVGFPATDLLVLGGASDEDAFKAFARASQRAAVVWYSAYPNLSVQQIDGNSTLREGLVERPEDGDALEAWTRGW